MICLHSLPALGSSSCQFYRVIPVALLQMLTSSTPCKLLSRSRPLTYRFRREPPLYATIREADALFCLQREPKICLLLSTSCLLNSAISRRLGRKFLLFLSRRLSPTL